MNNLHLSMRDLQRVLTAVRNARPLPRTGLQKLDVFQNQVNARRVSKETEDYFLIDWIGREIENALAQQREHHGLRPPDRFTTRQEALEDLEEDFRQNSPELEAWSILYYRYVRVDLEFTLEMLGPVAAQNARTLRRRQQRGLQRLLHTLLDREVNFRRQ